MACHWFSARSSFAPTWIVVWLTRCRLLQSLQSGVSLRRHSLSFHHLHGTVFKIPVPTGDNSNPEPATLSDEVEKLDRSQPKLQLLKEAGAVWLWLWNFFGSMVPTKMPHITICNTHRSCFLLAICEWIVTRDEKWYHPRLFRVLMPLDGLLVSWFFKSAGPRISLWRTRGRCFTNSPKDVTWRVTSNALSLCLSGSQH